MSGASYYMHDWIMFLRDAGPLTGVPLAVGGVLLVIGGWRVWKYAAVLSFALLGGIVGQVLAQTEQLSFTWIAVGAIAAGLVGMVVRQYSSAVLAGVITGALAGSFLSSLHVGDIGMWIGIIIGLLGGGGWAYANRQQVISGITSVEGGALLVSGLAVMIAEWPTAHSFFSAILYRSPGMVVFFVFVPTVVGILLQHADEARSSMKSHDRS